MIHWENYMRLFDLSSWIFFYGTKYVFAIVWVMTAAAVQWSRWQSRQWAACWLAKVRRTCINEFQCHEDCVLCDITTRVTSPHVTRVQSHAPTPIRNGKERLIYLLLVTCNCKVNCPNKLPVPISPPLLRWEWWWCQFQIEILYCICGILFWLVYSMGNETNLYKYFKSRYLAISFCQNGF